MIQSETKVLDFLAGLPTMVLMATFILYVKAWYVVIPLGVVSALLLKHSSGSAPAQEQPTPEDLPTRPWTS